jgi:hypothetical protein
MTLVRAPFGSAFLSSDQPVAVYHESPKARARGVGPQSPGVEVTRPLSSRALLILDHGVERSRQVLATTAVVDEFNRRTVVKAQSFVFAGEGVRRARELVRTAAGQFVGFRHEDRKDGKGFQQIHRFYAVGPP